MEAVNKVFKSKDYSKFNSIEGNRVVNQANLRKLIKSMQEELLQIPIIVNEWFHIIDGQHRFEACKQLNLPVYFIIVEGYKLKHVHKLNAIGKKWSFADYLDGYTNLGYEDYVKTRVFMETYGFGYSESLALLLGRTSKVNGSDAESFYNGTFKIKSLQEAEHKAKQITSIKPFYDGYKRMSFVLAMLKALNLKEFSMSIFLQKLSFQSTKLVDCTDTNQYLLVIENIYNYKSRTGKLRLL
jgi:hypothetical protein